jgi:hypothetical protein
MTPCQIDTLFRVIMYPAGIYACFTIGIAIRDVWRFFND